MQKVTGFLFALFHIGKGKRTGTSKTGVFFLTKTKYMFKSLLLSLKTMSFQTFYLCIAKNCGLVKIPFSSEKMKPNYS